MLDQNKQNFVKIQHTSVKYKYTFVKYKQNFFANKQNLVKNIISSVKRKKARRKIINNSPTNLDIYLKYKIDILSYLLFPFVQPLSQQSCYSSGQQCHQMSDQWPGVNVIKLFTSVIYEGS